MLRQSTSKLLGLGFLGESRSPAVQVLPRFYHERVVDHYNNPRNVGSFDKTDPTVGTGLVGAPACGDVMKLQIKVDDKTGKIVDACFKTFGCGSAIASASVGTWTSLTTNFLFSATEWVNGRQMEEVLTIKNTEIAKHLSLPPVKLHCSMLAEDAIKAAVKDYEAKRASVGASAEVAPVEKAADA
ncbi:unnamed protein product [Ilex paraguariensis]|uniref:Iron-sulfur cluster assembly protein n=1 Tax=Ilex paraguariensis TaxID=185542 RepID=A0ABC8R6R5_9AQUA